MTSASGSNEARCQNQGTPLRRVPEKSRFFRTRSRTAWVDEAIEMGIVASQINDVSEVIRQEQAGLPRRSVRGCSSISTAVKSAGIPIKPVRHGRRHCDSDRRPSVATASSSYASSAIPSPTSRDSFDTRVVGRIVSTELRDANGAPGPDRQGWPWSPVRRAASAWPSSRRLATRRGPMS